MAGGLRRLLVRVDADHEVGLGHAVRVGALLAALEMPLDLVVVGRGTALSALFPHARHVLLSDDGDEPGWAGALAIRPEAVLVDLPRWVRRPWARLRAAGLPIAAIDDEGGVFDADLVINGAVLEECHRYQGLPPGALLRLGPAYTLLRPEFSLRHWRPTGDRSLSIVIGSGGRARPWAEALAGGGLDDLALSRITLTVGLACPEVPALRRLAGAHGIAVHQGVGPDALACQFAGHAVSLMTGGMVVPEALATGAPVVAYPQVDNLVPEMRWFAAHGALTDLGPEGGQSLPQVRVAVARLLDDPAAAARQSEAARSIIDGLGAARAARAIKQWLAW